MKQIYIFVLVLFLSNVAIAQQPIEYSEVVEVPGASKSELLKRGQIWLAETFVDSREVIEYKNDDILVGRGAFDFKSKRFAGNEVSEGVISYTLKIMFKDGRYKYSFSNFQHTGNGFDAGLITDAEILMKKSTLKVSKGWANKTWIEIKEKTKDRSKIIVSSLINNMSSKESSDW